MTLNLRYLWKRVDGNRQDCPGARPFSVAFRPIFENLEERTLLSQSPVNAPLTTTVHYIAQPQPVLQIIDRTGTLAFTPDKTWDPASGWAAVGGLGTVRAAGPNAPTMLLALGDFNNDGIKDPVLSAPGGNFLVLSKADGSWQLPLRLRNSAQPQAFFLATGDFNGDDRTDITLASRSATGQSGQTTTLQVLLGKGDGTFYSEVALNASSAVMSLTIGSFASNSSLTVGDLDGDSATDLVLTRASAAGSTIKVLFGTSDLKFPVANDVAVAPGPYTLQVTRDSNGQPHVKAVVPAKPNDPGGVTVPVPPPRKAPSATETSTDDDTEVVPPVRLQTLLPDSGLSIQIVVDPFSYKGSSIDLSDAQNSFWSQVIASDNKADDSTRLTDNQDNRLLTSSQNAEPTAKATPGSSNPAISTGKASTTSKASALADALEEQKPDHKAGVSGTEFVAIQINLTPVTAPAATEAAPGKSPDAVIRIGSTAGKAALLAIGLDEAVDGAAGLLSTLKPILERKSQQSQESSGSYLLDVGQVVLQAMIIVKLTPGGPGPQNGSATGVISNTDSLMRVAELVKESSQMLARLVRNLYQRYLGRDPEPGEDQGWVNMMLGGDKQEGVLAAFLSTREFSDRAESLIPEGAPDEKYLQGLYLIVLERRADSAEVSAWLESPTALSRQQTALALVNSNEFRAQQIAEMFRDLAGREGTPTEIATWANTPFDLLNIRQFFTAYPDSFGQP